LAPAKQIRFQHSLDHSTVGNLASKAMLAKHERVVVQYSTLDSTAQNGNRPTKKATVRNIENALSLVVGFSTLFG
jgi:hypothetical protein